MKAHIDMCIGMNNLVYYNEQKVNGHEAECIYAGNFLKDARDLSLKEKRTRFADLITLNPQTHRPAVSLVLEFAPGEKLTKDDLIDIARDAMDGTGFGNQPYLVYHHTDTAHQHMHIISTKVLSDGDLIKESFIGVHKVQPTAREIEKKYHLALESPKDRPRHNAREKIQYGKSPTWQAITDTVQYVVDNYRYRSIDQLNAALRLYNLTVKAGSPGSDLNKHRGLLYQVIDETGKHRNAPVKASELPFKPTLKNLEPRFEQNNALTPTDITYTRMLLDKAINAQPPTPVEFIATLRKEKLAVIPSFDRQGALTVLHFIDLGTKTVLTPDDLGTNYSPKAIENRLGFESAPRQAWEKAARQEKGLSQEKQQTRQKTRDQDKDLDR